jgi:CBS domain-containing protein
MRAADVMVRNVVTVRPETDVGDAVKLLIDRDISALPVVDAAGWLVGILSEADLIRRTEINTDKRPGWIESLFGAAQQAEEYAKSHGKRVAEVMTENVVAVAEETPLSEIATIFERRRIKRVPVTRDGRLVGIVSRSNLIQALATALGDNPAPEDSDRQLRDAVVKALRQNQEWTDFGDRNVTVRDGIVHLWGLVGSEAQHKALLALTESVSGVNGIVDEMIPAY